MWDIIKYVAETSDKAGVIGFDFRVAPDGLFEFFPKNSKTNAVNLFEKIETSEYRKDISRVRNRIKIFGEATKSYPLDKDGFTEILHSSYGDWTAENGRGLPLPPEHGSIAQDSSIAKFGTSSIKCHILDWDGGVITFTLKDGFEVDCNRFPSLFFNLRLQPSWSSIGIVILLDVNGKYVRKNYNVTPDDQWKNCQIDVGAAHSDEWDTDILQEGFDWTKIKKVRFGRAFPMGTEMQPVHGWGDFWLDGLYFGGARYVALQENVASANAYGLREYVEIDEELWSDNECNLRAKALLAYLKDPAEYLTIVSTVVDYGTTPILAGDKMRIVLPAEGVNADFRVEYAEYHYLSDAQQLEIQLELGKEPPQIADYLYGLRTFTVNVEKLARTKRGGKGAAASGVSGGGGGGTIGYNGVGMLEVHCAIPTYDFEALEPYLWGFNESGEWTPDALTLPLGTSVIRFKDETTLNWLELGLIIAGQDDPGPMLWLSQALAVKKDFACGGMLTSFQGALFLGSGLQAQTDMPQIVLAHSEAAYGNRDTLEVWRFGKPGLAKVKCEQLLVNSIKKVNGADFADFLIPDEYGYVTVSGIRFGQGWGDIYRASFGGDNIIVISGLGLGLDGYLNCKSISLNPPAGRPALASDSSALVCTGINADLLDGYHASSFLGNTANVAVAKVGGGTRTLQFSNGRYMSYSDS